MLSKMLTSCISWNSSRLSGHLCQHCGMFLEFLGFSLQSGYCMFLTLYTHILHTEVMHDAQLTLWMYGTSVTLKFLQSHNRELLLSWTLLKKAKKLNAQGLGCSVAKNLVVTTHKFRPWNTTWDKTTCMVIDMKAQQFRENKTTTLSRN